MLNQRTPAGRRRRGRSACVTAALVLLLAAFAQAQGQGPQPAGLSPVKPKPQPIDYTPRTVTLECPDGVKLAADYFPPLIKPEEKAPVAVLIHMYPADRSSWKPLIPELRQAGFAVLAYDIRGHAGSAELGERNLKQQYDQRDPALFAAAAADVDAAINFLARQPGCDAQRCVLVGASIGCSIALNFAPRTPVVKAIICLSPGTNYMEMNSLEHIRFCADRAVLLIAPKGEYQAVEELIAASDRKAVGHQYPGGVERHGTRMFSAPYARKVIAEIVEFAAKAAEATGATVPAENAKPRAEAASQPTTTKPRKPAGEADQTDENPSDQESRTTGGKSGEAKSADKKPPADGNKKSSTRGDGRRGAKKDPAAPDKPGKSGKSGKPPAKPRKPAKPAQP